MNKNLSLTVGEGAPKRATQTKGSDLDSNAGLPWKDGVDAKRHILTCQINMLKVGGLQTTPPVLTPSPTLQSSVRLIGSELQKRG